MVDRIKTDFSEDDQMVIRKMSAAFSTTTEGPSTASRSLRAWDSQGVASIMSSISMSSSCGSSPISSQTWSMSNPSPCHSEQVLDRLRGDHGLNESLLPSTDNSSIS